MQVTVEIPDDFAARLTPNGLNPSRAALEAWAIEGYRSGALSPTDTRLLLGFETRYELDTFLKSRNIFDGSYSLSDLEQDRIALSHL